jgi:hypothetical protein
VQVQLWRIQDDPASWTSDAAIERPAQQVTQARGRTRVPRCWRRLGHELTGDDLGYEVLGNR